MSGYGRTNVPTGTFDRKVYALYTADEYETLKADLTRIKENDVALRVKVTSSLNWLEMGHALINRLFAGDYSDAIKDNPERRPYLPSGFEGGSMIELDPYHYNLRDVIIAGEKAVGRKTSSGNILRTSGSSRMRVAAKKAGKLDVIGVTKGTTRFDPSKLAFKPTFGSSRIKTETLGPAVEYNTTELALFRKDLDTAVQTLAFWAHLDTVKWQKSDSGAEKARTALALLEATIAGERPFKVLPNRPANIEAAPWRAFVKTVTEKAPPVVENARATGLEPGAPAAVFEETETETEPLPSDEPVDMTIYGDAFELSLQERIVEHVREHPVAYGAGAVAVVGLGYYWWRNR